MVLPVFVDDRMIAGPGRMLLALQYIFTKLTTSSSVAFK
jgi:hypothetical protein